MTKVTIAQLAQRIGAHSPRTSEMSGRIQAAVAILLTPDASGALDLLFIKRAEAPDDPWSGHMALPGGRREDQDPDLSATARRETFEETGIVIPPDAVLGVLDDLAPVTPVLPPVVVRPFVFALAERPSVTPSPEVAGYVWTSLDDLPRTAGDTDIAIRGLSRVMPAYLFGPYVVWGMTHRILNNFLEIALK
ncbi:MAG: CoA pyrophosphatase [Gemmatimonadales bacterium]|nr:CoA pyrophosphatase [Gemmatimonadales bacterium]